MNIENMKKMNSMINELRKHGISNTSDEAAEFAKKLYPNGVTENITAEAATEGLSKEETLFFIKRAFASYEESNKKLLQDALHNMWTEINDLKARIKEHEEGIILLSQRIEAAPKKTATQPEIKITDFPQDRVSAPQAVSPPPAKKEPVKSSNQRMGDMRPGDVDIAKFFYCGKK